MNWLKFAETQGRMAAKQEQLAKELHEARTDLRAVRAELAKISSLQSYQKGAYKGVSVVAAIIGAAAAIAVRLVMGS